MAEGVEKAGVVPQGMGYDREPSERGGGLVEEGRDGMGEHRRVKVWIEVEYVVCAETQVEVLQRWKFGRDRGGRRREWKKGLESAQGGVERQLLKILAECGVSIREEFGEVLGAG